MDVESFLSEDEQKQFNSTWFPRKIQDEVSNKQIVIGEASNNFSPFYDLYEELILKTKGSFYGVWINAEIGDGISWLSEKILNAFNNKTYNRVAPPKLYLLKKNTEIVSKKLPDISLLIGEKQFNKCAEKSGLMEKSLWLFLSVVCAIIPAIGTIVSILLGVLNISAITLKLPVLCVLSLLSVLGILGIVFRSSKSKTEERREKFLNIIHKKETSKDGSYKTLIKYLVEKISDLHPSRILIIDEFSALDKLSQNVLQVYYESKSEYQQDKELWIIINTNFTCSEQSKLWKNQNKTFPKFKYAKLLVLNSTEKKKLVKALDLLHENTKYEIIKDVCSNSLSPDSFADMQEKLKKLQNDNNTAFRFLYLIASNAIPADMICRRRALIDKIKYTNEQKERDKYIYKILERETIPNSDELVGYFKPIKNFLFYVDSNEKMFRVRSHVVQCIGDKENHTGLQADLYRYCNGYWAMCWYFVFNRRQWNITWTPKLAHHLKAASCLGDDDLRKHIFDAHLFAIEKSIKFFLKKEAIDLIENIFELDIQEYDNSEELLKPLVKLIISAYLNFSYLPDSKKLKAIGYEQFFNFLKKDDARLTLANELLYKNIFDEIIFVIIEHLWEKILFLDISRSYNMKYTIEEKKELQALIDNYFKTNILQNDDNIGQKSQNIALWIWINALDISTNNELEMPIYNKIIGKIENAIDLFVAYSERYKNCRDDVEQTMFYTTMRECACIIIASILTIEHTKNLVHKKLREYKQKIIGLYDLNINKNNNIKNFDEVLDLMQIQSILWLHGKYITRSYNLIIIRIQFYYSYKRKNYTIEDEQKYNFKDELGNIATNHHLNTIANFTLCNLYSNYNDVISDYYFQNALNFLENTEFTKIQLEYMFICIVLKFHCYNPTLEKVMSCFVSLGEPHTDDILYYVVQQISKNYTHIINTLREFKNENAMLFFSNILKQLKYQNDAAVKKTLKKTNQAKSTIKKNIEEAESLWRNFEFQKMNKNDKLANRKEYEDFWKDKEKLFPYSSALTNLLNLEEPSEELKDKAFIFLTQEKCYYYSGYLYLACTYLNYSVNNQNNKYYEILETVRRLETERYFSSNLQLMKELYSTLHRCTQEQKYDDTLIEINLKLSQNELDNHGNISAFDFLCSLCNTWLRWNIHNVGCSQQPIGEIIDRKTILNKYEHAPDVIVKKQTNDGIREMINGEFLFVNELIKFLQSYDDKIRTEYQDIINKCDEKAEESLHAIVNMIIKENPKYTEQIERLYAQWDEDTIFGEEEEELV
ncbi:MAG: hypothetical protein LBI42_13490 [Chitinispirillales bacterium]|jgi:hypothetical protein|nr:hypothetical protein [Chitinispirillales bacterium]